MQLGSLASCPNTDGPFGPFGPFGGRPTRIDSSEDPTVTPKVKWYAQIHQRCAISFTSAPSDFLSKLYIPPGEQTKEQEPKEAIFDSKVSQWYFLYFLAMGPLASHSSSSKAGSGR